MSLTITKEVSGAPPREHTADKLRSLDGLRAVSILLVLLGHVAGTRDFGSGQLGIGDYAHLGVVVFFVISGFLITSLLVSEHRRNGRVSLRLFYARRALRIFPASYAYVAALFVLWTCGLLPITPRDLWHAVTYTVNHQPDVSWYTGHLWSLSVEEQFYFVWPALLSLAVFGVAVARRSRRTRRGRGVSERALRRLLVVVVLAGAASLAWSIYSTRREPAAAYFSTFARAWELALGAALAILVVRIGRLPALVRVACGWLGLLAIVVAAVLFTSTTAFPGYAALLPTLGAALIIGAGTGDEQSRLRVGRLLELVPMRYVGDRSYAFYLWHWPVLVIAAQYAGHDLSVGVNLLLLAGAFALSVVSYRFFENPIRRARWRTPVSVALVPASVAAVAVVAVVTMPSLGPIDKGLVESAVAAEVSAAQQRDPQATRAQPLPGVVAAVKAARGGARLPSSLTPPPTKLLDAEYLYNFPYGCVPVSDSQTSSEVCRLGDPAGLKSIVVFGDSHMQMWMPTILRMAEQDGWVVIPLVKSGCVPAVWLEKGYPRTPSATIRQCHAWYQWAIRKAKSLRPDVILTTGCCGSAPDSTGESTKRAYFSLANAIKRVAKSVIVLGDNEGVDQQPVDCLLGRKATMKTCTTTWPPERFLLNDSLAAQAKSKGYGFMNGRGWFCYESQCPMVVGRTVVYRDTGHITKPYGLQLLAPFRATFRRCVLDVCPR